MINQDDVFGAGGDALVWIIDGECLYDLPVIEQYLSMFTESDEVLDVTDEHNVTEGIVVRFLKNGTKVEDFHTSEYFGNILLSNPQIESLLKYPYGHFVISPHATFDGEKFTITNRDVSKLPAWHPKSPYVPEGYFDQFTK